ncbi:MAG: 4Fe-4S domain-containing protein [Vulcanimicrobiaceae bacterium]
MSNWIVRGLRRGILTTRYPLGPAEMPPAYRGRPALCGGAEPGRYELAARSCLSEAIAGDAEHPRLLLERCFQCGQCARVDPDLFEMQNDFELTVVDDDPRAVCERLRGRVVALGRSVFVRHVDAGSDGSCEQELQAIFNPFYDANRLGIFMTATPRHADVLVVTGVVTHAMAERLQRTYEAMPEPKIVVALGTAAASGSIFRESPAVAGPVDRIVPVDVKVAGAPPAPLTILHGLWVALGRAVGQEAAS